MTTEEFEWKWLRVPDGILANDPRRFDVARPVYAVRQRMTQDGMAGAEAVRRVLKEPYYRDSLVAAVDPLDGDRDIVGDFRSITAP